jgi:hypothetical protein
MSASSSSRDRRGIALRRSNNCTELSSHGNGALPPMQLGELLRPKRN